MNRAFVNLTPAHRGTAVEMAEQCRKNYDLNKDNSEWISALGYFNLLLTEERALPEYPGEKVAFTLLHFVENAN